MIRSKILNLAVAFAQVYLINDSRGGWRSWGGLQASILPPSSLRIKFDVEIKLSHEGRGERKRSIKYSNEGGGQSLPEVFGSFYVAAILKFNVLRAPVKPHPINRRRKGPTPSFFLF